MITTVGFYLCVSQEQSIHEEEAAVFSVPSYACQRRTPLDHHNTVLTVHSSHTSGQQRTSSRKINQHAT